MEAPKAMKKMFALFVTLLLVVVSSITVQAQNDGFNMQFAVYANGNTVNNQTVTVNTRIRNGQGGVILYEVNHTLTTNSLGIVNYVVGNGGTVVGGSWNPINWASDTLYVGISFDAAGGTNFGTESQRPLLSVARSKYANNAGAIGGYPVSTTTPAIGEVMKWNGTLWAPGADNGGATYTGGTGINITGSVISNTGDTNPADDITNASTAGGDISGTFSNLQLNTGSVGSTEIADGSITATDFAAGVIPTSLPPSGTAGGDLNGSYPNPTVDGLQGIGVAATTPTNGQVLKYNGTNWAPATDNAGIGTVTQINTGTGLTGGPITSTGTIALTNTGVTAGTYNNVTVDAQGRVTSGSNATYLTTEVDGSTTNEIQTLSLGSNTLSLSLGGGSVSLAPYLDNTDAQTLNLTGNQLSISGGNTVTLPTGTTYTAGTGINLTGNVITNTAPDQAISLTGTGGTTITGTYPNFTVSSTANVLPTGTTNQTLRHDGTTWVASNLFQNNGTSLALNAGTPNNAYGLWLNGSSGQAPLLIQNNGATSMYITSARSIGFNTFTPTRLYDFRGIGDSSVVAILPGAANKISKLYLGGQSDLNGNFSSLTFNPTTTYLSFAGKPTSGPALQLMAMDFNNMTIGVGYDQVGNVAVNPVTTSTFLVGATSPTQAQGGVIRGVFNGAGTSGTQYYGIAGISDPTTSGARGVGVLASGDYLGARITTPSPGPTANAATFEGNVYVTTGNKVVVDQILLRDKTNTSLGLLMENIGGVLYVGGSPVGGATVQMPVPTTP